MNMQMRKGIGVISPPQPHSFPPVPPITHGMSTKRQEATLGKCKPIQLNNWISGHRCQLVKFIGGANNTMTPYNFITTISCMKIILLKAYPATSTALLYMVSLVVPRTINQHKLIANNRTYAKLPISCLPTEISWNELPCLNTNLIYSQYKKTIKYYCCFCQPAARGKISAGHYSG